MSDVFSEVVMTMLDGTGRCEIIKPTKAELSIEVGDSVTLDRGQVLMFVMSHEWVHISTDSKTTFHIPYLIRMQAGLLPEVLPNFSKGGE